MSDRERLWTRGLLATALAAIACLGLTGTGNAYPAPDDFASESQALHSPAINGVAITPNDSEAAFLAANPTFQVTRGIYVGTSGNLTVVMAGGQTVTYSNVPVGLWPWRVKQVLATGTTATGLVGNF